MPKRGYFYLIAGVIIVFALILVGITIFKKPTKLPVVPGPIVEAPKVQVPAVEAPVVETPKVEAPLVETALVEVPVVAMPSVVEKKIQRFEFQKGMCYVAWSENGYSNPNSVKAMEQALSLGVEWVGLLTTWYQDQYNSTKLYPLQNKTPTDESLIFAIRKLHELKFKIMLKPHLDLVKSEGKWRGEIEFNNPGDWQAWFDSYAAFILHYADIAAKENVELFCIGTELTQSTLSQPQAWRDLIEKIRQVFKGQLTYAANWDKEYKQILFWDALDYAGIDAYFPLICSSRPKVEELISVWQDWIKDIEEWQQKINKPVIFPEIGYKSSRDATDEPWQYVGIGELDLQLQANCYQALLESFWDKPWFYGVYWWHWGTHPRMGGELHRGFTPQNKPAQEVIREWYNKSIPEKAY